MTKTHFTLFSFCTAEVPPAANSGGGAARRAAGGPQLHRHRRRHRYRCRFLQTSPPGVSCPWCGATVDSDDDLMFPEDMAPERRGRGAGEFRRRIKFSREKDEALIRFVVEHGRQLNATPTAPKFWEMKAFLLPPLLAVHTPLSIHTHFTLGR